MFTGFSAQDLIRLKRRCQPSCCVYQSSIEVSIPAHVVCCRDLVPCSYRPQVNFPGGSVGKESVCNAEDMGSIPRSGGSPGEMATHCSILA